jgi:aminoglycoside 6'-N-acetyltransferase I
MKIGKVTQEDFNDWLELALALWPEESIEDIRSGLTQTLHSDREAGFLVRNDNSNAIGFMNLSLRYDYVPGATQSPVAYVEGIYVKEKYQRQGVGTVLIQQAEQWALEQGCVQLASDALLGNNASHEFHTKVGFQEVERVVTFIKAIAPNKSNQGSEDE